MTKCTYQPNKKRRILRHGYRSRARNRTGLAVLKRRRLKGRKRLTV